MRSTWPNQFNICFFNKPNSILSFQYQTVRYALNSRAYAKKSQKQVKIYFPLALRQIFYK